MCMCLSCWHSWVSWIFVLMFFINFGKFLAFILWKKNLAHFKFLLLLGFSLQTVWYYPIGLKEKAMATHSSSLAWKIPWMEEPGRLQPMVSLKVGHDWVTSLSLFTFMHWRRKWQPTPVFLPAESHGWGSVVGCRLWGRTESNTTEVT